MRNILTYPHLLVGVQFALIGLMVFFSRGVLSSPVAITFFLIGVLFGLWAILHNQRGNFHIRPILKEGCTLITTGPYRLIRHPDVHFRDHDDAGRTHLDTYSDRSLTFSSPDPHPFPQSTQRRATLVWAR